MPGRKGNGAAKGILAALAFLWICQTCAMAWEKSEYVMGIHFDSALGKSSAQIYDYANALIKIIMDNAGVTIRLQRFDSVEEAEKALVDKKIDTAILWPSQVAEITDKYGDIIFPWATYSVQGSRRIAYCLWHKKSEKKSNGVSDIIGTSLIRHNFNPFILVQLRQYLFDKGLDKPLWNVFKTFTFVQSQNSALMAVTMGKADFYWTDSDSIVFMKLLVPNAVNQLAAELCSKNIYARNSIVMNKKMISISEISKFRDIVRASFMDWNKIEQKYPEYRESMRYFNFVKAKFIPADEDEFKTEIDLYKKARQNGWLREADYIIEKLKTAKPGEAVSIKPDFKFCKEMCAGSQAAEKCIDRCMQ